jgi:hypothetical protein
LANYCNEWKFARSIIEEVIPTQTVFLLINFALKSTKFQANFKAQSVNTYKNCGLHRANGNL